MKGMPVQLEGSLTSKPTWSNTQGCSATSAFLFGPILIIMASIEAKSPGALRIFHGHCNRKTTDPLRERGGPRAGAAGSCDLATGVPAFRPRFCLAEKRSLHCYEPILPGRFLGQPRLAVARFVRGSLFHAHARRHRGLPPLLCASFLQDESAVSVCPGLSRLQFHAEGAALVGGAPSATSSAY